MHLTENVRSNRATWTRAVGSLLVRQAGDDWKEDELIEAHLYPIATQHDDGEEKERRQETKFSMPNFNNFVNSEIWMIERSSKYLFEEYI
jgi:hypothetical protein